ncbi:GDP-L-fucose synthase [Bacteroidales bacterium OttesenSCG-928-J19]|nr:GDP-L-fucose synthase [Bacteroidales bacterium OttesenSCG-928-J19]
MERDAKIYIAGHRGLVGSALLNNLRGKGYRHFILRSKDELDLLNQQAVDDFFQTERPDYVFLAAAKVGGIVANNTYRGQFIYENLQIQNNVIHSAYKYGVKKLLFLGSTCIYPAEAPQPMPEDCLLTSPLEYTNEPYALAKIAGIKMCESYNLQYGTNFIAVMPTNLYGPNDNFDLEKSHVLPALIRKVYLAKCRHSDNWDAIREDLNRLPIEGISGSADQKAIEDKLEKYGIRKDTVEIWGTGTPMREFLWSEEMADACVFVMEHVDFADLRPAGKEVRNTHINIGTGKEISIRDLAFLVAKVVAYEGGFTFNTDKPDGTMRKLTDPTKLHDLGWHHKIDIEDGVEKMFRWYTERT